MERQEEEEKKRKEFIERYYALREKEIKPLLEKVAKYPDVNIAWTLPHRYIFTCNTCKNQLSFIESKYNPVTLECSYCDYKIEVTSVGRDTPMY